MQACRAYRLPEVVRHWMWPAGVALVVVHGSVLQNRRRPTKRIDHLVEVLQTGALEGVAGATGQCVRNRLLPTAVLASP